MIECGIIAYDRMWDHWLESLPWGSTFLLSDGEGLLSIDSEQFFMFIGAA